MEREHDEGCSDSEMAALVAHELRAPLTVIEGYLDLLATPLPSDLRETALDAARRAANRMEDLLDDMLSATCAHDLFVPAHLTCVSMKYIAEEAIAGLGPTTPHRLEVVGSCPGWVMGEQRRLEQVLLNLLSNSIKYSPSGSQVRLLVSCDDQTVSVVVEDEGPGIPEVERERVFEQFTRLDPTGAAEQPGIGLGLYIVRAIVAGHGGSVHVENVSGGTGARFLLTFPAACPTDDRPG